ncbi:MAG: cysteine rich repeat-containing protein [Thermodesulfobacteriota bacterium]
MYKRMILTALATIFLAAPAFAAEDPLQKGLQGALDTFSEGCRQELTTFCKDVTPGEGRILACLYAFQDKLSPRCEYALYDSVGQLDRFLTNLSYAVGECREDLRSLCADVKPGQGRLLDCLDSNEAKVSKRCNTALRDVGYKK